MSYTYTIFDGDPMTSGDCAWPDHQDVEVEAADADAALAQALETAESEGLACGEYASGDRLWVLVWDDDGMIVADGSVTLEAVS